MSKFIGIIFPDDAKASEGSQVLKKLHAEGSLALSGMAIVSKDGTGAISIKREADEGPLGTLVGALIGGLAGLPTGPIGSAIGAVAGGLVGRGADHIDLGERMKFTESVSQAMNPGSTAVLAEITEYSATALETRMNAIGGILVRE
jgi:uncharacterized membrane protein